jgi:hypothetical protein
VLSAGGELLTSEGRGTALAGAADCALAEDAAGPGIHRSSTSPHMIPFDTLHEGSRCV